MQAIESASLSLSAFRERSGFADAGKSSALQRKDITDALKSVFWTFSLLERTGLPTLYALERFFEPSAFGVGEESGNRYHRNKWPGHAAGRTRPQKVLPAVELKCPGANACLTSPLWDALTGRPLTRHQLDALVLTLEPGIESLVRRRGTSPRPASRDRSPIDVGLADTLERRCSLDALAAAVILLRIAHVEGATEAAYQWGRRVLRIVLLLGDQLNAGGITRPLLELIDERVMMLAVHDGVRPGFPPDTFLESVTYLNQMQRGTSYKDSERETEAQRRARRQRLLNGSAGVDCLYAFNPIVVAGGECGETGAARQFTTPELWLREWALNMLDIGGHHSPPPAVVRTGTDLWAAREGTVAHKVLAGIRSAAVR